MVNHLTEIFNFSFIPRILPISLSLCFLMSASKQNGAIFAGALYHYVNRNNIRRNIYNLCSHHIQHSDIGISWLFILRMRHIYRGISFIYIAVQLQNGNANIKRHSLYKAQHNTTGTDRATEQQQHE